MSSIDNRIVEMQFENKQFENGIAQSTKSIDNLKKSLKLDGAAKGFENLDRVTKGFSLSSLVSSVETVSSRFSTLGIIGVTALQNITNSAMTAGKRLVDSFTMAPVLSGFQEYETQINAVQTILANTESKGENLQTVNKALDELNQYADKTIYNFTEMTRNIGTFTAAGVDLDTSVGAIKGIANLAAVSGSTSQQASSAMYQLSQALASGTVKLMDWNSVVNAGMGGQVFQDALKETARVHGIAIDDIIKSEGSFRESLSKGWLSSEILTETLSKFTGDLTEAQLRTMGYNEEQIAGIIKMGETANDAATKVKTFTQLFDTLSEATQSGWTESWELIVGDFENAKELLTNVSNIFGDAIEESSKARNQVLRDALYGAQSVSMKDWTAFLNSGVTKETTAAYIESIKRVAKEHGIAVDEMIDRNGSFAKSLKEGWLSTDILSEALDGVTGSSEGVLEKIQALSDEVISGKWGMGTDRINKLAEAGYDYQVIQDMVNSKLLDGEFNLENYSEAQLESFGYTKDQTDALKELKEQAEKTGTPLNKLIGDMSKPTGRELLIDSFSNAFEGLNKILGSVKKAYREVFPPLTGDRLYKIIDRIHDFTGELIISNETADDLKRTFRGAFAVLDIGKQGFLALAGGAKDLIAALSPVGKTFLRFTGDIGDFLVGIRNSVKESKMFENGVKTVVDGLKNAGSTIKNSFIGEERYSKITESLFKMVDNLGNAFAEGSIKGKEFVESFINSEEIKKITSELGKFKDKALDNLVVNLDRLSKTDPSKVLDDFLNFLKKGKDGFSSFSKEVSKSQLPNIFDNISEKFGEFGKNVGDLASSTGAGLKAFGKAAYNLISDLIPSASSILIFSSAISVLVTSFSLASLFRKGGQLAESISGVMKSTSAVIDTFNEKLKPEKEPAIMTMAKAIGILAGSLALLTFVDQDKLKTAAIILGALATGMAVFTGILESLAKTKKIGDFSFATTSMLGLSASVLILAAALKVISTVETDGIMAKVAAIGLITFSLGITAAFMGRVAPKLSSGSLFLLAFSLSITNIVRSIKMLEDVSLKSGLKSILMLRLIMAGLGKLAILSSRMTFSSGAGVFMLIMSIRGMVRALTEVGKFDINLVKDNIGSYIVVFGALIGLTKILSKSGNASMKTGVALIGMAAAIFILVDAIEKIGSLNAKVIGRGTLAVSALMVFMGVFSRLSGSSGANGIKAGATLLAMSVSISILVRAVAYIGKLDRDTIMNGVGAVAALGLLLAGMVALTKFSAKSIAPIIAITISLAALVGAIAALSTLSTTDVRAVSESLAMVIASFSLLTFSSGFAKKTTAPMLAMSVALIAIAGVLAVLSQLPNASAMTEISSSLSKVLLSLAKTAGIMSVVGVKGSALGSAGLGIMTAAIVGIIAALGGLRQIPGFDWLMGEGTAVLGQIGAAIGAFSGNILGGFASGALSHLPKIGFSLSNFAITSKAFFDQMAKIDPASTAGVGQLADVIIKLTGASILEGIASFVAGKSTFEQFSEQLPKLGDGLKKYATSVSGLKTDGLQPAIETAKSLSDLASSMTRTGGMLQMLIGENTTLYSFGSQLPKLGNGLKKYAASVSGIKTDGLESAITAAQGLSDLANTLPNEGGVLGYWLGENGIGVFGEQLPKIGDGLKKYATSVSGLKTDGLQPAIEAANALAELADILPNTGGLIAFFSGDNNIADFGDDLADFGDALSRYNTSVSTIDTGQLSSVATELEKFVEIVNKLSELDMTGAYSFQGALGALGSSGIDQFITAFSEATPQSESAGTEFAEALTEAIQTVIDSYAPQLATSGQTMMQGFITALVTEIQNGSTALNIAMQTVAEGMIRAGVTALLSGAGSFRSAGMTLGNAAAGGIGSLYQRFYTAGSNAARGFINGIISGRSGAITAAASVASAALTAANNALRIHSPSKEFERTGMYSDQGFANGFLKYAGVVKHASETVGKEALNTVHGLLLKLNDVVTSDLDMTPTIRPVIDFSDITRGAGVMNNLLASGTYGVNANLYGIGQSIDRRTIMRNQKAMENSYSDTEVIRAINRLGEQLFTLKDAIAGMQVVMNSGALVGSIGGKMDARLGQIAGYKERGI